MSATSGIWSDSCRSCHAFFQTSLLRYIYLSQEGILPFLNRSVKYFLVGNVDLAKKSTVLRTFDMCVSVYGPSHSKEIYSKRLADQTKALVRSYD